MRNTFSGIAGEARVAAELVRCGLRVAKPYWADDEVDLLVLVEAQRGLEVPLPIQVKSIQLAPPHPAADREEARRPAIHGLKKRYVEQNPALCLAIYRPDTDDIWFINGAENIKRVYDEQASASARGERPYTELREEDDVTIAVEPAPDALREWLVPKGDAAWITERLARTMRKVVRERRASAWLEGELWPARSEDAAQQPEAALKEEGDVFTWIAARQPGSRSKEDIDGQIAEERAGWGDQ